MTDHKSSGGRLLSSSPPRRVRIVLVLTSQKAARLCILTGLLLTMYSINVLHGLALALPIAASACLVWAYWVSYYHRTDR